MKKISLKIVILLLCFGFFIQGCFADNITKAEKLLKKAKLTAIPEESYDYINSARELYFEEYEKRPTDIKVLLGLSNTFQLLEDRSEAKLYIFKAYNMDPTNPDLQKKMGDFHYSFQEYSTAVEYYKLSLASGNLRDFDTNLQAAKCFEKLGDIENARLYYRICHQLDSKSRRVLNKLRSFNIEEAPEYFKNKDSAKYKYLYKEKPPTEEEIHKKEIDKIIREFSYWFLYVSIAALHLMYSYNAPPISSVGSKYV